MVKITSTEEKIFIAATSEFLMKGLDGARMQEIANKAGINKALLHYYFRSKEKLFKTIFVQIISKIRPVLIEFFTEKVPLETKVTKFVSGYIDFISENPHIPIFVLNELRNNPDFFVEVLNSGAHFDFIKVEELLKKEYEKGNIIKMDHRHFIVNMISLTIFPFVGKPIIAFFSKMNEIEFQDFIEERKRVVPKTIMNSIRP